MKVSLEITDFQFMKAVALTPANEEQAEAVMAAVPKTSELDITEFLQSDKDYQQLIVAVAATAIAVVAKANNIE